MTRPLRSLSALCAAWLLAALPPASAVAQEQAADWRSELEAVCVKTDAAMTLSSEELADLLSRCDRLAEQIGAEGEIVRRIYLKRLNSCRALFAYVLESRGVPPAAAPQPGTPPGAGDASPPPGGVPAPAPGGTPSP
jgi:hypothetical protein